MENGFILYYSLNIMEHKDNSDNDSVWLLLEISVYISTIDVYFRNTRNYIEADHCSV